MNRPHRLLFLACAALVAGAVSLLCAKVPPALKEGAVTANDNATARGMVWKIEGGRAPVYLAGSFHLLRRKDLPLPGAFEKAYQDSQQVWFEIPPGDMEKPATALKLLQLGMLPADQSLEDTISAEVQKKVEKWAGDNPTIGAALPRMRAWMAALTIMLTEYQKIGAEPQHGVEQIFTQKAAADNKPTGGFETAEEQLSFFAGLDDTQQEEMLGQTFDELAQASKLLKEMIEAWKTGDDKTLGALMHQSFEGHDDFRKLLLDDRNARWIEPIEKFLAGDTATLVIVGAGHLCGDKSVIDLLQQKGWKITRVEK